MVESLEKRAEALLLKTQSQYDALKKEHLHLLTTLELDLTLADGIVLSLKDQLADKAKTFTTAQVHVIEEDLVHLENSISLELKNIQDVITNHKSTGTKTNAQLLTHAHELIAKAHAALTLHRHTPEAHSIEREISVIESLIRAIEAKPTAADLAKDEASLARHEKTLQSLIDAASHRVTNPTNPHNPHTNPGTHHNPGK